ncbi:nitroreductase family protein [Paenibacillus sp. RC343]|uniref:nitroreductase family protein n=1 Tax=Paenibacillus sp. RC343 TaxID=3045841 RepID=UPI0024BB91D8|nr:nitroreductase family protein [Paenibacillus sp. RC343]
MKLSDLVGEMSSPIHFMDRPVPQQLILELLNHAVWAPNDGLREPWRFIFADNCKGGAHAGVTGTGSGVSAGSDEGRDGPP